MIAQTIQPRLSIPSELGRALGEVRDVLLRVESATVAAGPLHDQVERLIKTFDQVAQTSGLIVFRVQRYLETQPVKTIEVPPQFSIRSRRDETAVSRRRIWTTEDGHFRVVYARCKFGPRRGPKAIPPAWYAEQRTAGGWDVISKHHKARPAFRACLAAMREAVTV